MIDQAALQIEPLGPVTILRIEGTESMGDLPWFWVDVLSEDPAVDLGTLIGADAILGLADAGGGTRAVALTVIEALDAGAQRDGQRYRLGLSAWARRLTLRAGYKVFQQKTTRQIIAQVLEEAGLPAASVSWRLAGEYHERVYCVQYGETDWGFCRRLLADEGFNVWLDLLDDKPKLVFGDHSAAHGSIEGAMTVRFEDPSGLVRASTAFYELSRAYAMCHEAVHVRDFDVMQPDVLIEGNAGDGPLEHYEFAGNNPVAAAAAAKATVRLQQLRRFAVRVTGRSGCARLQPGRLVRIEGAADEEVEGDHLIVSVSHVLQQASKHDGAGGEPYHNEVVMVPFSKDVPFRPELPRDVPRVDGLETATITGAGGEEICVDELGSVRVRFPWDTSGIADDRSSRWVRCLQMNMAAAMVLPRVGWEVPVVYVDGNPDMPFVLGRVYNGAAATPYGMPGKMAVSTIQSATSPGGGTTHEIRLSDDAGSMEAFVHATKDQTVTVGGNHTVKISASESHDVKKSSTLTVSASQTVNVSGNQSITAGADGILVVKGARSESVSAMENIGVTGSYLHICKGSYGEVIGGAYALQCNQSNTKVQGSFTQAVGGPLSTTAGLGSNNSVAAARLEDVGGARSYAALASYADSTRGVKKVTAGSARDTAGTDVVTNVSGIGTTSVGGSITLKAGGVIAVEAPKISITVGGSLTAKGGSTVKLGGKVKASGKVKFDAGKTKKTSKSKVG